MAPKVVPSKYSAEAVASFASVEHGFGQILYEFFFACFNVLLYYRGLHSPRFFTHKYNSSFGLQIPYMRFPETIAYLEKVTAKGVNCFMAGLLDAFVFEEKDAEGHLTLTTFRLNGTAEISQLVYANKDLLSDELRESCSELIGDLKRTLENANKAVNACSTRWKVVLVMQRLPYQEFCWKTNRKGVFAKDPDWNSFPWTKMGALEEPETVSSQEITVLDAVNSPVGGSVTDLPPEASSVVDEFGCMEVDDSFEDSSFDGDSSFDEMELQDYEKEGFSVINYEEKEDDGRESPDFFASSQPSGETVPKPFPRKLTFHLEPNHLKPVDNRSSEAIASSTIASDAEILVIDDPVVIVPEASNKESPADAENIGITTDRQTSPDWFNQYREFKDMDHIFDDNSPSPARVETTPSVKQVRKEPRLYVIATKTLLRTVVCNILILKKEPREDRISRAFAKFCRGYRGYRRRDLRNQSNAGSEQMIQQ